MYSYPSSYVLNLQNYSGKTRQAFLIVIFVFFIMNLSACKPNAVIVADPTSGLAPLAVHFNGSNSTDIANDITLYEWDFDSDGTPDADEGMETDHTYGDPGTYTAGLTVIDKNNNRSTATQEIQVYGQPNVNIWADDTEIAQGQTTTLHWESEYATSVTISPGIGAVEENGSFQISPSETTIYTITAENPYSSMTDSVTVSVVTSAPQIDFFEVACGDSPIQNGSSTTLSWQCSNTDAATVYIEPIGTLDIDAPPYTVSPEVTTTYTLMVTGPGGATNARVTVKVACDHQPLPEGSFGQQYENLIPEDSTVEEYDIKRFSVITGLVEDSSNMPLDGVSVTVHGHPEFGTDLTDLDGRFSLPIEGGTTMTVFYHKEDYLPVHRQVYVSWNEISIAETIVMSRQDSASTLITFDGNPDTVCVHQSNLSSDPDGERRCTLVFEGDTQAYAVNADGEIIQELPDSVTVRATEYTVGDNGPQAMPADLPPNVAYTYCAEFQVDGVDRVQFSKPVITWVDNFLGFEVGTIVPVGFYDKDKGAWIPEENGTVVRLLDTDSDGVVDAYDATGDGNPDGEAQGLDDPSRYSPDDTFWRVEHNHFSTFDYNFPFIIPEDGIPPNPNGEPQLVNPNASENGSDPCTTKLDSYAEDRNQIFHEDIPVPGTDLSLHYASSRSDKNYQIIIPACGDSVPASLSKIIVQMSVAGKSFEQEIFSPAPNQVVTFTWDEKDAWGNQTNGPIPASIKIGFAYPGRYLEPGDNLAFAKNVEDPVWTNYPLRQEAIAWKHYRQIIHIPDKSSTVANGWTLSPQHRIFPFDEHTMYKGDGSIITNNTIQLIDTIANFDSLNSISYPNDVAIDSSGNVFIAVRGSGIYSSHGLYKIDASGNIEYIDGYQKAISVAVDNQDNLYVATYYDSYDLHKYNRIYQIDKQGNVTHIAGGEGTLEELYAEGMNASDAWINPRDLAIDNDGNIFFADSYTHRVRKIDQNGLIWTVAGTGNRGPSNYPGPAKSVNLAVPKGITFDQEGNMYIANFDGGLIFKIDTSGHLTYFAGGNFNQPGCLDDGIPATEAWFYPNAVTVDKTGNVYLSDNNQHKIRKIDKNGIITTIAGCGGWGFSGDGGPAIDALLRSPCGLDFDENGNMYIAVYHNYRVRKVSGIYTEIPNMDPGDIPFVEEGLGHIFDFAGYHKKTIDLDTGTVLYEFGYENRDLTSITDRYGDVTAINRNGNTITITSPDGITTTLYIDGNNNLSDATYPDGSGYHFAYTDGGLMIEERDPNQNIFYHTFDEYGRLSDVYDPEEGHWNFEKNLILNSDGWLIQTEVTSGEQNTTIYEDSTDALGFNSFITGPSGDVTEYHRTADELHVEKYLPCGKNLTFEYTLDPEYKFKYIKEMHETTADLEKVTTRTRSYGDLNQDEIPDSITDTITVNGKVFTIEADTLNSSKTFTTPEGRTITSFYEPETLLTTELQIPGLYSINLDYDDRGRPTYISMNNRSSSITYNDSDLNNRIVEVTDPRLYTTTYHIDTMDRLQRIDNPDGRSVYFSYDANGNIQVLSKPRFYDGNLVDHIFSYNGVNLAYMYDPPVNTSYSYEYDRDRKLTKINFPSGRYQENTYVNGRLNTIDTSKGDSIGITYHCVNNIDTISRNNGESISYGYDGALLVSETISGTLNQGLQCDYNNDFNVISFTYAGGDTVLYDYDDDGLLIGAGDFSITRQADNGLPANVSDGTLSIDRSFNSYAEQGSMNLRVGGVSKHAWNIPVFDTAGRIAQKSETIAENTDTYVYGYDEMGRLLSVDKNGTRVEEYTYGPSGSRQSGFNLFKGITSPRTLNYSDEDQLLTVGDGLTYQYDADGFLQSRTENSEITTYKYSAFGELLSIDLPDTTEDVEYIYGPLGRRIAKKKGGIIVEKYLWQGFTRLLAVYDAGDNLKMRFVYADARMPVAMKADGATYYLSYDQVGSLRIVVDASGNIQKQIDYDTFGYILSDSNPAFEVPFGFAGGLYDADTGLVHFGYRDYDPDTGRWTAKDPILFAGGDTDLYGYCLNDPVNWSDPDGLDRTTWGSDGRSLFDGPKNGNWGGKNWSGGQNPNMHSGRIGNLPPMDSGDMCYMRHDLCYEKCNSSACSVEDCKKQCDKILVDDLRRLPDDPSRWLLPPRLGTEDDSSDFRKKAIWYFD